MPEKNGSLPTGHTLLGMSVTRHLIGLVAFLKVYNQCDSLRFILIGIDIILDTVLYD
jgi:hypothetical protein